MYDLVVIGGGPAGYVAAIRAGQLGMKTACVERRDALGGTCLNEGCIPSKALLQSTENYALLKNDGQLHGIEYKDLSYNFSQMMRRKGEVVKGLTDGIPHLFQKYSIDWVHGGASFIDPRTVQVEGKSISGKYILLATGSEAVPLPFLPFDERRVLSSTGALSLPQVPSSMIVVGAGVIGVELGSVYQRLGTQVTFVEMMDKIIPMMDGTICKAFLQILKKQGMVFHLGAKVLSGQSGQNGISLEVQIGQEVQKLNADTVLVCVGRRPYTKGLGLEKTGVEINRQGQVVVDGLFRTSVPHIFAVGDLIDGPMLAHKASEEGMAAVEVMAGMHPHVDYISIPNVVYTHPEVASVGLTEEEAKQQKLQVFSGISYFKGNPRARCAHDTEGLVKVIGDQQTGKLLGVHIVGPHASEMIGEGVVALEKRATVEQLAYASHAHPTLAEAIKEAAFAALKRPLHG